MLPGWIRHFFVVLFCLNGDHKKRFLGELLISNFCFFKKEMKDLNDWKKETEKFPEGTIIIRFWTKHSNQRNWTFQRTWRHCKRSSSSSPTGEQQKQMYLRRKAGWEGWELNGKREIDRLSEKWAAPTYIRQSPGKCVTFEKVYRDNCARAPWLLDFSSTSD